VRAVTQGMSAPEMPALELASGNLSSQRLFRLPSCIPTREEVRILLGACRNPLLLLALRLMYFCGLRQGDVLGLKAGDVMKQARVLFLRSGKGDKDRYVLVDPATLELIEQRIAEVGWDKPLLARSESWLAQSVGRICRVSGLYAFYQARGERFSGHSLRHAFATHRYEQGMSFATIKDLLGHEQAEETLLYAGRSRLQMRPAYDRCNPFCLRTGMGQSGEDAPSVEAPYPAQLERIEEFSSQPEATRLHGLPGFPSHYEVLELLDRASEDPLQALLLRFLYASGLRLDWWLQVKADDIDWERRVIRSGVGEAWLDPQSWVYLENVRPEGRLFDLESGQVMEFFLRCAQSTGLLGRFDSMGRPLTLDCLRYAFAVRCSEKGMDPVSLLTLLGLRFYGTARAYSLCAPQRFLEVFDATTELTD